MHAGESFKVGIQGLFSNKTRAALTMLGIVFGVAAVISMMSIGEGAKIETLQQIELLGTNNIIVDRVVPDLENQEAKSSYSPGLTLKDANIIREVNPFVVSVTPLRSSEMQIRYKSNMAKYSVIGTTPNYPQTYNSKIILGIFFDDYHNENATNVCVIGSGVKEKLFRFEDPISKRIKIGDLWFKIIGVAAPKNISSTGMKSAGLRNFNDDIYIPLNTMTSKMEKFEVNQSLVVMRRRGVIMRGEDELQALDKSSVDQLTVKIKNSDQLNEAANLIERILKRKHNGVSDYKITLPEQLLEQKQKTQRIFNIVMGAIAGISLLVGGIGIMNIMLANILERTREIGVRRAVGATRNDILAQFMFEAVTISVSGGLIGILLGFFMTKMISTYAGWKTLIAPLSVFLAFFVSAATGIIFGIYPAKKAADKNPIESLRYE